MEASAIGASSRLRLLRAVVAFVVLAGLCAIPRFGQRENEGSADTIDSDVYLEMAEVFAGQRPDFDRDRVHAVPHHYARPLLSFLASVPRRRWPARDVPVFMSTIDIAAAAAIATLLFVAMPGWGATAVPWLPSVLFLTGFVQLDWGYHLLTDTLGLALAFGCALYASRMLARADTTRRGAWSVQLVLLMALSSLAFLARETAWVAVVAAAWTATATVARTRRLALRPMLVCLVMIAGVVPRLWYCNVWHISGHPFVIPARLLAEPRYLFDFLVKLAVCFNLVWVVTAIGWQRTPRSAVPDVLVGWTLGAALYMVAGYFANSMEGTGYPLRMCYVACPLLFLLAARTFEPPVASGRPAGLATAMCVGWLGLGLMGLWLDPGTSPYRSSDVVRTLWSRLDPTFVDAQPPIR